MANRIYVQEERGIRNGNGTPRLLLQLIRICRKPLVAYVTIAFAISLGFHELERRTDNRFSQSLKAECTQTNAVRRQVNREFIKANPHLPVKFSPLPMNDCSKIPGP